MHAPVVHVPRLRARPPNGGGPAVTGNPARLEAARARARSSRSREGRPSILRPRLERTVGAVKDRMRIDRQVPRNDSPSGFIFLWKLKYLILHLNFRARQRASPRRPPSPPL